MQWWGIQCIDHIIDHSFIVIGLMRCQMPEQDAMKWSLRSKKKSKSGQKWNWHGSGSGSASGSGVNHIIGRELKKYFNSRGQEKSSPEFAEFAAHFSFLDRKNSRTLDREHVVEHEHRLFLDFRWDLNQQQSTSGYITCKKLLIGGTVLLLKPPPLVTPPSSLFWLQRSYLALFRGTCYLWLRNGFVGTIPPEVD